MDLAVVGAGRVGTALAVLWQRAGHRLVGVSGREATAERAGLHLPGVPVMTAAEAAGLASVVVIATPDEAIGPACESIARSLGPGRTVAHVSGATGLDALSTASGAGAAVLSIHPLQTCPSVEAAVERIPGAAFAVTALDDEVFALGARLAEDAGGRPFALDDAMKPLHHAAAVFASNYVVTLTALAEELERAAGVADAAGVLGPLQEATLANIGRAGPSAALTGPAVRGDATTVTLNLEALTTYAPGAVAPYVALAELALELAERSGRLPAEGREAVREALDRWR